MVRTSRTGVLPTVYIVVIQQTITRIPVASSSTSIWHVCPVQSKVDKEDGAKLLCLSIPRKPKVRQTLMAGLREPSQERDCKAG